MRILVLGLILVAFHLQTATGEEGYGSVTGQLVFQGEVPELPPLVKQGDNVKDHCICASREIPDDSLLVDPKTRGIANVFIYLRTAPANMPLDLQVPQTTEVVMTCKDCQFIPHAMLVRTGQWAVIKSEDPVSHNAHHWPLKNQPFGFFPKANKRAKNIIWKHQFPEPEIVPIKVTCDIHAWMKAYWLILDHPYAAISNTEGKFAINNLPAGSHEFRIWQERVGYVDRAFQVKVKAGEVTQLEAIIIPREKFHLDEK